MTGRRLPAVVLAGVLGSVMVVATAAPAAAHTVTGVAATNYRSQITSVSPAVGGVKVRLLDLGRRVSLSNTSPADLVVMGYFGEPYLRVGATGSYQNRRSPTLYLNRPAPAAVTTPTTLPAVADPTAAPVWERVSDGRSVRWTDRRTRWQGPDPPAVKDDPGRPHTVVASWSIELRRGGGPEGAGPTAEAILVSGRVDWVPGPKVWAWLGLALALACLCVAMAFSRRWGPLLGAALAVLVATDVVHSFGTAAASGDSLGAQLVKVLLGGLLLTAGWLLGIWAVGALQRGRHQGVVVGGMAAFVVALYSGFGDGPTLVRSQVPFMFPAALARVAVATALGVGVGVVVACAIVDRRLSRRTAAPA